MDAAFLIADADGQSRGALVERNDNTNVCMGGCWMIALPKGRKAPALPLNPRTYRIYLKISPADREDAWELYRIALRYGGVEVSECCFAFANEERWLMALESIRFQFGPEYFDAVGLPETNQ